MGSTQKWPDLRSPISKIQDIRFVGTDDLIIFWKFHNIPWNIVALVRWESYFVVGSLDLTWWPDLTWPWAEIFTKVAEKMGGKVGENPAALRAAVFSLSSKTWGGRSNAPPPAGRGLIIAEMFFWMTKNTCKILLNINALSSSGELLLWVTVHCALFWTVLQIIERFAQWRAAMKGRWIVLLNGECLWRRGKKWCPLYAECSKQFCPLVKYDCKKV